MRAGVIARSVGRRSKGGDKEHRGSAQISNGMRNESIAIFQLFTATPPASPQFPQESKDGSETVYGNESGSGHGYYVMKVNNYAPVRGLQLNF